MGLRNPAPPDFSRICAMALRDFYLTAVQRGQLAEAFRAATSRAELPEWAAVFFDRAERAMSVAESPQGIDADADFENRNWLTPPPESLGIKSKAGFQDWLKEQAMSLEEFKQTPMYKLNPAYFADWSS